MNKNDFSQGRTISCPVIDGYYTYILRCSDGTFYTGWTVNLDVRLQAHNRGTGSRYTRARRPVELLYYEEHRSRHDAMSHECAIKQLSRRQKQELIEKMSKS